MDKLIRHPQTGEPLPVGRQTFSYSSDHFKTGLQRFMSKGGSDGFFLDEWTTPEDWRLSQAMVDAGLLKARRVVTGSAAFELTRAGRYLLSS